MLHLLIDLKEWRIGNPGGFSTKYKNDAKNSRAEYFLSQNSFEAIDSILDAQKEMIANEGYINLLNLAKEKNATNELEAVIAKIDEAKKELKSLPKDDLQMQKNFLIWLHKFMIYTILRLLINWDLKLKS